MEKNIHTEMDELIAKYLLQEATAVEIAQVDNWVAASDANKKAFAHYKLLWEGSKKIAATNTVDENEAWQKFETGTLKLFEAGELRWESSVKPVPYFAPASDPSQ